MLPIVDFVLLSYRRRILLIVTQILSPTIVFLVLFGIFAITTHLPFPLKMPRGMPLSPLPSCNANFYCNENTVYLGYSPDTPLTRTLVKLIHDNPELVPPEIKTVGFASSSEMVKNMSLLGLGPDPARTISSLNVQTIMHEHLKYGNKTLSEQIDPNVPILDIAVAERMIENAYGIKYDSYQKEYDKAKSLHDNIFLAIQFNISNDDVSMINRKVIPKYIDYTLYYNQTMFSRYVYQNRDTITATVGGIWEKNFWSSLSYTVNQLVDKAFLKYYLGTDYDYNLGMYVKRSETVVYLINRAYCFMGIGVGLNLILSTVVAGILRGRTHTSLRRLGVKEMNVLCTNFVCILILNMISMIIFCSLIFLIHAYPFGEFRYSVVIVYAITFALSNTSFALLLAYLFYSPAISLILSSFVVLCFVIIPFLIISHSDTKVSLWQPLVVPKEVTWTFIVLIPLFCSFSLIDMLLMMTEGGFHYTFNHINFAKIPIDFLTTDWKRYHSTIRACISSTYSGECTFQFPMVWWLLLISLLQSLLVIPIVLIILAHAKPEFNWRGMPCYFPFSLSFWRIQKMHRQNKRRLLSITDNCDKTLEIVGLKKSYNHRCRQIRVLHDINLILHRGEILGLVAASGSGKSTLLNILSGELKFDCSPNDKDNDSQSSTKFQVLDYYTLESPYDAYYLKPNIGYCPQDRTNVWMNMSVYENVYFSALFRSQSLGTYKQKILQNHNTLDAYVQLILQKIYLTDADVQRRLAKDLSGGMLRRLALANATAGYPTILLFDEITSGVDPLLKREIWAFVRDLVQLSNASAILTTHDASEIAELSTKVMIFREGRTISSASPLELQREYGDYTLSLIFGDLKLLLNSSEFISNEAFNLVRCTILEVAKTTQNAVDLSGLMISSMFPHITKISIPSALLEPLPMILAVTQKLEHFCRENGVEYSLSKAGLDEVFVKLIDDKQTDNSTEVTSSNPSTVSQKMITLPMKPSPMKYLFYKNWLTDYREYFLKLICVLIVNVAATALVVSMLTTSIKTVTESTSRLYRPLVARYAEACITSCTTLHPAKSLKDSIDNCFSTRTSPLFAPFYQVSSIPPVCSSYSKLLGLDTANNSYYVLGDNAYIQPQRGLDSSIADWSYLGVVTGTVSRNWLGNMSDSAKSPSLVGIELRSLKQNATKEDDLELMKLKIAAPQVQILPISTYDTITPFYGESGPSDFMKPAMDRNNIFSYYMTKAVLAKAKYECLLPQKSGYSIIARADCPHGNQTTTCIYRDEGIVYSTTLKDIMYAFHTSQGKTLEYTKPDEQLNISERIEVVRKAFINMPVAIINIHGSLTTSKLNFTLYGPLPPMGTQSRGFSETYLNLRFNDTNHYNNMPAFPYPDGSSALGYNSLQSPLRIEPSLAVPMLDQVVRLVGAIFRREIMTTKLANSIDYDSALKDAFNFTYTVKVLSMPRFTNSSFTFPDDRIIILRKLELLTSYVMPFVFLVPIIIVGVRVAREIEERLLRVFLLHNVPKCLFLGSHILYYTIWSFLASFCCIFIISISLPDFLWNNPPKIIACLLFLYVVSSFSCTTYSILAALLFKQMRRTILFLSVIVFVDIIYCSIIRMNEAISLGLSLVLPSLGIFWEISNTIFVGSINVGPVISCVIILLLHIGCCFCAIYFIDGCRSCARSKTKSVVHEHTTLDPRVFASYVPSLENTQALSQPSNLSFMNDFALLRTPMQSVFNMSQSNILSDDVTVRTHLDIKNVVHRYPSGNVAIKDVSFSINDGEVFALLGGNGAGKTTLMHALTGIHIPTHGIAMCIINDKDSRKVNLFNPATRHGELLTIIPQEDIFYAELTVLDHMIIMAGITSKNLKPNIKSIKVVLETVELYEHRYKRTKELSGGMQRRLTLAMVIVSSPSLVCLDEITTGLSSRMKTDIWKAILASRHVCRTMMLTTHDMAEVEALADRCCIMKQGQIVALGTVADIISQSRSKFNLTIVFGMGQKTTEDSGAISSSDESIALLAANCTEKVIGIRSGIYLVDHKVTEINKSVTYQFGGDVSLANLLLELAQTGILSIYYWTIDFCRLEQFFIELIEDVHASA